MKSLLVIVSVFLLLISGCKKNLDSKIYGSLSPSNFPKTESDFQSYILEVYKPFQAKWGYSIPAAGGGSVYQYLFYGYEYSDIQMNDATSDQIAVFLTWGGFYTLFSQANFTFFNQSRQVEPF